MVTIGVTCGAGESLDVRSWQFDTDDPESAGKDAVEKYRLSVGEGDVVEVVETVQVWSADR